jgi:hypothetical protein
MEQKHKVAAAIVAVLALGWFFRHELVTPHGDTAGIYKLDRLTGTVYFIWGGKQTEVKPKTPE